MAETQGSKSSKMFEEGHHIIQNITLISKLDQKLQQKQGNQITQIGKTQCNACWFALFACVQHFYF